MLRRVAPFFLIFFLGMGVYTNSVSGKFVYDDLDLVRDNPIIRSLHPISKFFKIDVNLSKGKTGYFYRPILKISYALDYKFWKLQVQGYHLTNIFFHILNALVFYGLVVLLFGDKTVALLSSLFFVVHPVHTEAVSYISGRADLLAGLFVLLALFFYIQYGRNEKTINAFAVLLFYVLALFSKEHSLIFLALAAFYHLVFRERPKFLILTLIGAATLFYAALRFAQAQSLFERHPYPSSLAQRLPGVFVALNEYFRLLFFPLHLRMEYGTGLYTFADPRAIGGVCLFVAAVSLIFVLKNKRWLLWGAGWFFITLVPVLNIFPINAFMAEHWLYLPSMGFFFIIAFILSGFLATRFRAGAIFLIVAATLAYASLTFWQNRYWSDPIYFYERTLSYQPKNARMHNNLAAVYKESGDFKNAELHFKRAIEIDPLIAEPYFNMGYFYAVSGRFDEALKYYQKAVALNRGFALVYNNIGAVYEAQGRPGYALVNYQKAFELDPGYDLARKNYYNLRKKMGIKD